MRLVSVSVDTQKVFYRLEMLNNFLYDQMLSFLQLQELPYFLKMEWGDNRKSNLRPHACQAGRAALLKSVICISYELFLNIGILAGKPPIFHTPAGW